MPLTAAVIKDGATALTPTGGADMTFTPDGTTVTNGIHLANGAQPDFRIKENMTIKTKNPSLNSVTNTWSKDKKSVSYVEPIILANGTTAFNVIRIEREVHPETSAAAALNLNMMGGQILADADFALFWSAGSLA